MTGIEDSNPQDNDESDSADPVSSESNASEDIDTNNELVTESQSAAVETESESSVGDDDKVTSGGVRQKKLFLFYAAMAVLAVIFLFSVAGLTYYGNKKFSEHSSRIDGLSTSIAGTDAKLQSTQDSSIARDEEHSGILSIQNEDIGAIKIDMMELDQRVSAQGKRLSAMSGTSRDEWLLGEAEYLLKLANQRVRIGRSAEGAEALLEEADNILRDLDDPGLHAIRRVVAQDLVSLRLMRKVDLEGIYLLLTSLVEQIDELPLQRAEGRAVQAPLRKIDLEDNEMLSIGARVARSWRRFTAGFSNAYRVIPKEQKPKRILPPDAALYVQQNLRMIIERAQMALLREQQGIYQQSLLQADEWLDTYYDNDSRANKFRESLKKLEGKRVVLEFPDISNSLRLIREYRDNKHALRGIDAPALEEENPGSLKVEGNFGGAAVEGNFGGPAVEGNFGGAAVEGNFGGPAVEGNFGGPAVEGNFGGPAVEGNFGGPEVEENLEGSEAEENLEGPEAEENLGEAE